MAVKTCGPEQFRADDGDSIILSELDSYQQIFKWVIFQEHCVRAILQQSGELTSYNLECLMLIAASRLTCAHQYLSTLPAYFGK